MGILKKIAEQYNLNLVQDCEELDHLYMAGLTK